MLFSQTVYPTCKHLKATSSVYQTGSTGVPNMDGLSDLPWERVWATIHKSGVRPVHIVGHIPYMFFHSQLVCISFPSGLLVLFEPSQQP